MNKEYEINCPRREDHLPHHPRDVFKDMSQQRDELKDSVQNASRTIRGTSVREEGVLAVFGGFGSWSFLSKCVTKPEPGNELL